MNAFAQAKHLFWKEYRTQRGLWLGLVGFCLIFHIILRFSFRSNHSSDFEFMVGAGYLTIFFYTLASTALLYAAEREQGTEVLLRTMPVNRWLFYGVKVSWVGCSALMAFLIFAVSALTWTQDHSLSPPPQNDLGYVVYAFPMILVLLCSLVATQLTRQVISAIGVTVAVGLLTGWLLYGVVYYLLHVLFAFRGVYSTFILESYHALLSVLLLAISLELNRRWFRDSDFSWRWGFRLTRAKSLAMALEDVPSANSWRLLAWKEWRSARLWLPCLLALSFFFVNLTHIGRGSYDVEKRFIHFIVNMCLIPLLAGVASCRSDQSQERYRFLGNRGVSSTQTILTKHAVWLGACALMLLFISLFVWTSPRDLAPHHELQFAGSLELIPISTGLLSSSNVERLSESLVPAIQFWACLSLLCYALGHWFSVSLKQPVMSMMVAIFSSLFVCGIVIFYYALDVPLFILTVVPSAGLLALSFIWGEDWLTDRRSRRDCRRPFWYGLLGLWTVVTLLASWRVLEIPFSTVIDTSGLRNLPTSYAVFCLIGLILLSLLLFSSDWVRTTFRNSSGRSYFVIRRDFTLNKVVVVFLVLHNLTGLAVLQGYQTILSFQNSGALVLIQEDINQLVAKEDDETDLYTKANDSIPQSIPISAEDKTNRESRNRIRRYLAWNHWSDATTEQKQWLQESRKSLPLFWEADRKGELLTMTVKPAVSGYKVRRAEGWTESVKFLPKSFAESNVRLINLVRLEALRLEHEGDLKEAWRHHLAVVRYARRFADHNLPSARDAVLSWLDQVFLNGDLWRWQARQEQTPERLAQASKELSEEFSQLSSLTDSFQREAGWSSLFFDPLSSFDLIAHVNLAAGMPWEMQRFRSLQNQRYALARHVAEVIDRNEVSLTTGDRLRSSEHLYYEFRNQLNTDSLYLKAGSIHSDNSKFSRLDRPDGSLASVEVPESVIETTLLAKYTPRPLATVFFDFNLADMFRTELEFWTTYRSLQSNFAIYSYRAETDQFPAALYDLKGTQTEELFDPVLHSVAVNTLEVELDQLSWIAVILKYDASYESYKDDYQWSHASKWPQPEYNLGMTPDVKPPTPLIAPQFKEVP